MSYQSNIVNLIKVRNGMDGTNGTNYFFEITPKEIKKYYEDANTIGFLDKIITLKVKNKVGEEISFFSGRPVDNGLYVKINLGVITDKGIKNVILDSTIMSGNNCVKEISIDDFGKYKISDDFFGNETYLNIIKEYECFLVFELYEHKNGVSSLILTDAMIISWALNDEYAKFRVTAMAIQGSVDEAGFKFDSNGLTISNGKNKGGITIKNKDNNNEVVFSADTDGYVFLKGRIEAEEGLIGKIKIADGGLTGIVSTTDTDGTTDTDKEQQTFRIDNDGIVANSGRFGQFTISGESIVACRQNSNIANGFVLSAEGILTIDNVVLSEKLTIGENCEIKAPSMQEQNEDSSFITVYDNSSVDDNPSASRKRNIDITRNGLVKIGNERSIILDGPNASIYSDKWDESQSWYITPTGAKFSNVSVSGSIKASVFEQGKIQTIDGMILLRPSSSIIEIIEIKDEGEEKASKIGIKTDNMDSFPDIGFYLLGSTFSNTTIFNGEKQENAMGKYICFDIASFPSDYNFNNLIGTPLINVFSINEKRIESNVGIGLNSSDNGSVLPERSISIFENNLVENYENDDSFSSSKGTLNTKIRALLGTLPESLTKRNNVEYGLYCDNVYLNGRLITEDIDSGTPSCGIDSKSSVNVPSYIFNFVGEDKADDFGKILLWAGGEGSANSYNERVQSSKFWVDSRGNFYAKKAYLENGIITNSTIEASELKAAKIIGTNTAGYALKIVEENILEDDNKTYKDLTAISFVEKNEEGEKEYFSVDKNLIKINTFDGMRLIDEKSTVNFSTTSLSFKDLNSSIIIGKEGQEYTKLSREGFFFQKDNRSGKLTFEEERGSFGITLTGSEILNLTEDEIDFEKKAVFKEKLELWGEVTINKSSRDKGFDLYIGG